MIDSVLYLLHYALLLIFGILLSTVFSAVKLTKQTLLKVLPLYTFCAVAQIITVLWLGEDFTWRIYPLIVHLPLLLFLVFVFHVRIPTALASICSAYLCCQPAKWFGLLFETLTKSSSLSLISRILVLTAMCIIAIRFLSAYIARIYTKDTRSVLLFSAVPLVYYIFDYMAGIYTDFWFTNNRIAAEFLSMFLCVVFIGFCVVYYKEYEQKADAERKAHIIRISIEQQAREIADMKQYELETCLIRHDLRLLLDNLSLCIKQGDQEGALRMISGFSSQLQPKKFHRYCENDTINYILSNYENKALEKGIATSFTVSLSDLTIDETTLALILSNALDNALNAQEKLPKEKRRIRLMLKQSDGKLLFSLQNPYSTKPILRDGIPISTKKGHGYGTQSIRYLTERAGGKCQFSLQSNEFILRVVL